MSRHVFPFSFIFLTLISPYLYAQTPSTGVSPDLSPELIQSEKPGELRAVWITTAYRIDFPKSTDTAEQKASLDKIFRDVKAKKFNAVFFQVRIRGDVLFDSPYEPQSDVLTGTLGKRPSYDATAYAIGLARKHGLTFHAWFNTMIVRGKQVAKTSVGVPHLWQSHPEWIDPRAIDHPSSADAYLNPAHPEVQAHLVRLIADFARRYDVDGIQLDDYLRYPASTFPDSADYLARNPQRLSLGDWRREAINTFVAALSDTLNAVKPYLRFGITPLGTYRRVDTAPVLAARDAVYQDSREWTKRKKADYLVPQLYFHLGSTTESDRKAKKSNPAFELLAEDWAQNKNNRHLYIGIGTYKPAVKAEWQQQLIAARKAGAEGVAFYPYSSIADLPALFSTEAMPPQMPWKSISIPEPPDSVFFTRTESGAMLSWKFLPNTRASIRAVNLYKQLGSEVRLEKVLMSGSSTSLPKGNTGTFFVTSVDRFGHESRLSTPIVLY